MKIIKNLAVGVFALIGLMANPVLADDNEVLLDQTGDNLVLTILQAGYGNTLSGDATQSSDLVLTGNSLILDLIQDGNNNDFFGKLVLDGSGSSVLDFYMIGDGNIWDINVEGTNSADNADMLSSITGSNNLFDVGIGESASAENLNFDLTIIGSGNDFDTSFTNSKVWASGSGTNSTGTSTMVGILVDSDNAIWNFEITGDDNELATKQSGNSGHSLTADITGSDGDFQFTQDMTTTCTSACNGVINVEIDSENASVSIKQTD
ncbi:hypothetical protein N9J02_00570 [bacterium]|jgi:hypothetical protein|nr:hypothetical protein [bacterium]